MTKKAVIEVEDDVDVIEAEESPETETEAEDETEEEVEAEEDSQPDTEAEEEDESEIVVSFGEDSPASEDTKEAPKWVRDLRKQNREQARRIRELEAQTVQTSQRQDLTLGPKPTLESVDYDTDKYEAALDRWKERKAEIDRKKAEQQKAAEAEQERWKAKIDEFNTQKQTLKVKDFEDAEETVGAVLNNTQLGVIVMGAQNKALLMYALGKDEKRLADLAKITDPVEFAFAVARMETQLKTQPRKPAAKPEKTVSKGSAPVSGSDSTLERLREEAMRTGDMSKVHAYKQKLRNK